MHLTLPQYITDLGTLLGIVSFFMTVWVVRTTNLLKDKFKNKARIPEIHKELENKASTISSLLRRINNWSEVKDQVSKEFSDCVPLIESLIDKINDDNKSKIKETLSKIAPRKGLFRRRERQNINDSELAWTLYQELSSLNTRVNQILKDMRWD
ncbi:hypothetical protein QMT05_13440 [Cronobacter malonaticus]|uniref:hypothetical protein n=1 Tax=Cronobacter malonaticus TaxID=413503 RepID=UPI0024C2B17D|nr:hypothetical protein [Cronobacter malonaticus]MDK1177513.1 hypothetical protein [Cronobacter malonaticus]MDK1687978.1 hypothetical protein [Cronobacter malonaticus]